MADGDEYDDEMDDAEEEGEAKPRRKLKFSLNLQPFWAAVGRVIWMGAVGVIVMGTYVVGTRYELAGSKKIYRIDRMTGSWKPITEPSSPRTAPGGFSLVKYYLPPAQIKALKDLAKKQKRDINELARDAINSYLSGKKSSSEKKKRDKRRKPEL